MEKYVPWARSIWPFKVRSMQVESWLRDQYRGTCAEDYCLDSLVWVQQKPAPSGRLIKSR